MKKIEGSPKNLKQLLQNTKYSIHYYQREYMWQRKQFEELIEDLTAEFLIYYKPEHQRKNVGDYGSYFMGSVVLAGRDNAIIDGQQRFSSLTLLLIYLHNRLKSIEQSYALIENMIFSESFGTKSFNINVEDREPCMHAIFNSTPFDAFGKNESIVNLYKRYNDISEIFPEDIDNDSLLYFCDWLCEKVFFIEIVATTEQDAHKIFVSMNDRGLSLTSAEMLKGYILSEIKNDSNRETLNELWKNKIIKLKTLDKTDEETFFKAWLRAQYAETIRETKAGAENKDFDLIGGPFHKWVRDEKSKLGLNSSVDYENFINKFNKFSDIFLKIKVYENAFSENQKHVYYNAKLDFTFQTQLLMAPICFEDLDEIVEEKMRVVSKFIDLFIYARATNYRSNDYNTIKNAVFTITKKIRNKSVAELKEILKDAYLDLKFSIKEGLPQWSLNAYTKKYIKHMLARITGFIETNSGFASNYCTYVNTDQKYPFEVEHITPDHYEWYTNIYETQEVFNQFRNNIGDLLILHKHINSSLNDKKYDYKLKKYCSNEGNIFAGSLGEITYSNNPQFKRFIEQNHLSFKAYESFGKEEILARNVLVEELVVLIWNTDNL